MRQPGAPPAGIATIAARADEHGARTVEHKPWWDGPLKSFAHRLIALRTLHWTMRLAVLLTFAQLVAVAALIGLGLSPLPLPFVSGDTPAVRIPALIFFASFASLLLAWAYMLTGAIHGHWSVRWLVLAVFTLLLGAAPANLITSGRADEALGIAQAVPLVVIWLWALAISLHRVRARPYTPGGHAGPLPGVTFLLALVALLGYYGPVIASSLRAGDTQPLALVLEQNLSDLYLLLIPVAFLAGTDFAETGEAVTGRIAYLIRRFGTAPLFVLTGGTAAAILVYSVLHVIDDLGVAQPIPLLLLGTAPYALAALLFILLARLARAGTWPRLPIPFGTLLAATLLSIGVEPVIKVVLGDALAAGLLPTALGLLVGVPLLLRGRRSYGALAVTGMVFVAFALQNLAGSAGDLLARAVGLPVTRSLTLDLTSAQMAVALVTLAALLALLVRRRGTARAAELLTVLFVLDGSLLALAIFFNLYGGVTGTAALTSAQGLLLALAFFWDFLTSGEQITNTDGRAFPRYARVLLYAGYTMVAATEVLYFSSHATSLFAPRIAGLFIRSEWSHLGLVMLGGPILFTTAALALTRWEAQRAVGLPGASGTGMSSAGMSGGSGEMTRSR